MDAPPPRRGPAPPPAPARVVSAARRQVRRRAARPAGLALGGLVAAALVGGACGEPPRAAAGIVVALDASGGSITGFTLRTPEGQLISFVVGELELDEPAFAASHLTEHAVTLQPIAVAYRVVEGRNVVHRMVDAPWAGPSP